MLWCIQTYILYFKEHDINFSTAASIAEKIAAMGDVAAWVVFVRAIYADTFGGDKIVIM